MFRCNQSNPSPKTLQARLELATFRLEVERAVHCATGAQKSFIVPHHSLASHTPNSNAGTRTRGSNVKS